MRKLGHLKRKGSSASRYPRVRVFWRREHPGNFRLETGGGEGGRAETHLDLLQRLSASVASPSILTMRRDAALLFNVYRS